MPVECHSAHGKAYRNLLLIGLLTAALSSACGGATQPSAPAQQGDGERLSLPGRLLAEASGLQHDRHAAKEAFWAINDSGHAAELLHFEPGHEPQRHQLPELANRDWEDLAWMSDGGRPLLVIGDIGDNRARRNQIQLHFVELTDGNHTQLRHTLNVRYPDGPRDAEGLAWDSRHQRLILLSKRDQPARLYTLNGASALQQTSQQARLLGELPELPWPDGVDPGSARAGSLRPTALDISPDGRYWAVLTYVGAYLFKAPQTATDGLGLPLRSFALNDLEQAEGISFAGDTLSVISEGVPTRLARLSWRSTAPDGSTPPLGSRPGLADNAAPDSPHQ